MKWDTEGPSDVPQSNGKPWEGAKKRGGIQFYGDVKRLLILSKAPERVRIGGPSGLVGGENDHSQVLG